MSGPDHSDRIRYSYAFKFDNGTEKVFNIVLDARTLELIQESEAPKPEWTRLNYFPCDNCPLTASAEFCPVAVNLSTIVSEFRDTFSYEKAVVTVVTPERSYFKDTNVQKGLSSLIGIYMVTSNCPVLDKLRPLTRFHLPFATSLDTLFRVVSMYLTAQFFVRREGKNPDWDLKGLIDIYKSISVVNRGISHRLANASLKDANVNAIIILHSFGDAVPYFIENGLDEIKHLFSGYIEPNQTKSTSGEGAA